MILESIFPTYENPTLENNETSELEPIDTEKIGQFAGRLATTVFLAHEAVLMPGAEIATLEGAMALIEAGDAAKFRKNAQNN
jgi:hypothetical protein